MTYDSQLFIHNDVLVAFHLTLLYCLHQLIDVQAAVLSLVGTKWAVEVCVEVWREAMQCDV